MHFESSILIGFSIINHPFWRGAPIFGNTHIDDVLLFLTSQIVSWTFFASPQSSLRPPTVQGFELFVSGLGNLVLKTLDAQWHLIFDGSRFMISSGTHTALD